MMTQLNGTVQSAPNESLGFDTDTVVSLATAQQFARDGYKFCIRYLSLGTEESPGDLTYTEASEILAGGLALMPVQHVSEPGWIPSGSLGTTYGTNAANNAQAVGFPANMNIWCDLEGIGSVSSQAVIDYCNAWYEAVAAAGYLPGLYVGANCLLNSQQLYDDLKFQHYWKSESDVPTVAVRSYQMIQYFCSEIINGLSIDKDITYIDNQGGVPQWLIATC